MKNFKKLIKEAHLGNPLNEISTTPVSGTKSGATYSLDSDRELVLKKDVKGAKIGDFINITLPKGTTIYNLPGGVFAKHKDLDDIFAGRKVRKDDKYGFSVIRSRDTLAAIEDAANLEESVNEEIDPKDIVIYDGEEHIITRKDGNWVYIRPLEDSAILGKRDEIKVPARALAYKSDLDQMYDEYKPKDEVNEEDRDDHLYDRRQKAIDSVFGQDEEYPEFDPKDVMGDLEDEMNEEFSSTEQKMINQIKSYKKRGSDMVNLPSKVREFYFKNKEEIDALIEKEKWPKTLPSRYSDEYRFELEKVTPTYQDKPGRAKYRVIDIESGELKGTPVFGTPESLMAYADDLIKPQGGTQSTNLGESSEEKDYFEHYDELPDEVLNLIDIYHQYTEEEFPTLKYLNDTLANFEKIGWTFDFGLDMEPFGLKPIMENINEGTCGYTPDGEPRSKPAGPDLNENEIPLWLTDNREFEKAVIVSTSYNDFEKRAYGILGPKYFKLFLSQSPGVLKDYYDSIRVTRPSMEEGNGGVEQDDAQLSLNVSSDAALDDEVSRMRYNESLKKSLKEALNKRLGK